MRQLAAAATVGAVLLVGSLAPSAGARPEGGSTHAARPDMPAIQWGVADDMSKYADDGGAWFYQELAGANLTENRWTLAWDPTKPSVITELPFLQRAAPLAQEAGIHVVLALYSAQASRHNPARFCAWAAKVAATASTWGIHDYIVWNEPNTRLYWTPQKSADGRDLAAPAYEALLARCYDSIHAADADATVVGMGLSPRASTPESSEPLVFLRDVGAAYRASGRKAPIMDQLSIHPYPNPSKPTNPPDIGYESEDRFGVPDLDRVKQAVWDAFNGTRQPTTVSGKARHSAALGEVTGPLTFRIDEIGWQTNTAGLPQYVNPENVPVVSEPTQAQFLKTMTQRYFACDPTVTDVELFLLVDEKYRNGRDANGKFLGGGWQSGLLTAGGADVSQPKEAYKKLARDWAAGRKACRGPVVAWSPLGANDDGTSRFEPKATKKPPTAADKHRH
jgi:hypothetical protein